MSVTTLSDKDMMVELLAFFKQKKLAEMLNCSSQTISNFISDATTTLQSVTSIQLKNLFAEHVKKNSRKVKISSLFVRQGIDSALLVNTPDGFQEIINLFIRPNRDCVKVETVDHSVNCSTSHLFETSFGWVESNSLEIGDEILTKDGFQPVTNKVKLDNQTTYDFEVAHENHRYWAGTGISSHNCGKSFLLCNILRNAQEEGAFVLVLDSENALDEVFLSNIGVKTDEAHLQYVAVSTFSDVTRVVSEFITSYEKAYGRDNPDAPKVVIALDSLDMLLTDSETNNFEAGVQKGDQGQRSKQAKHMLRTTVNRISRIPVSLILTHQVYPNTDIMNGQGLWIINNAVRYSASQILLITNGKLKEGTDVIGIRMRIEAFKSRFAKLGSKVEIEVPYSKGMSPFSGFVELLEAKGVLGKEGFSYVTEINGEKIKFREKNLTHELVAQILTHPLLRKEEEEITALMTGDKGEDLTEVTAAIDAAPAESEIENG